MGILLFDLKDETRTWKINFWHWRAIVEAIRRLNILSPSVVDGLHEPFTNQGLSKQQSLMVAQALADEVLSKLKNDDRLLIDGEITDLPDDGTFYKGDASMQNYSTNKKVVQEFIDFCRKGNGFEVC